MKAPPALYHRVRAPWGGAVAEGPLLAHAIRDAERLGGAPWAELRRQGWTVERADPREHVCCACGARAHFGFGAQGAGRIGPKALKPRGPQPLPALWSCDACAAVVRAADDAHGWRGIGEVAAVLVARAQGLRAAEPAPDRNIALTIDCEKGNICDHGPG